MKRIFSKFFYQSFTLLANTPSSPMTSVEILLAEEDITIVGIQLEMHVGQTTPIGNDGMAWCSVEVSQAGIPDMPGTLCYARAHQWWNTSPAGIDSHGETNVVMLPEDVGVTLPEEGRLYAHIGWGNDSAGNVSAHPHGRIFYVKGRTRS